MPSGIFEPCENCGCRKSIHLIKSGCGGCECKQFKKIGVEVFEFA